MRPFASQPVAAAAAAAPAYWLLHFFIGAAGGAALLAVAVPAAQLLLLLLLLLQFAASLFVVFLFSFSEHLHPAWAACAALAEPGAPAAVSIEAYAAAALQQKQRHKQQQKKEENQQQKQQQQVELCLGAAWVAACVRDVVGPLFDLGFEAQLHFFELCDPEGILLSHLSARYLVS